LIQIKFAASTGDSGREAPDPVVAACHANERLARAKPDLICINDDAPRNKARCWRCAGAPTGFRTIVTEGHKVEIKIGKDES
jgi:hypothetical protein